MKKALWWIIPLLLIAAGAVFYFRYAGASKAPEIDYKTATIEKKRIVGRITASGTLQAVVTVQVGSQVSGRIEKLNADFNSTVKQGELIAVIEPQLFQAAVAKASADYRSARASAAQAQARATDAERQYKRVKELNAEGLASQVDVDTAQTTAEVAKAQVDSAKASIDVALASLNQAKVNLSYTKIVSPIDGTVISRNVDVGQTVAASLSAPVIFTIAEDLRKMQVNTSVSEGDVGRLEAGMSGFFTVDAFPGQRFKGTIAQIRNAAQTVQNVVTYNALIDVSNDDLKLRPGMTANVTLIYAEKEDALTVPNQALRFRAPPELAGTASASASGGAGGRGRGRGRPDASGAAESLPPPAGSGAAAASGAPAASGTSAASGAPAAAVPAAAGGWGGPGGGKGRGDDGPKTVWVLRDGKAQSVNIQTGLTDGTNTEILSGDLHEGDQVITDATVKGAATSAPAGGAAPGGNRLRF